MQCNICGKEMGTSGVCLCNTGAPLYQPGFNYECPDCKGIVEHIPDIKVKLVAKVEVKKDTKGK